MLKKLLMFLVAGQLLCSTCSCVAATITASETLPLELPTNSGGLWGVAAAGITESIPIDVYLGPFGQSNACGKFGPVPSHLIAAQQHYLRYWTQSGDFITSNVQPLSPSYAYGSVFASELSFGQAFSDKIAIIKVSKSGSAMAEWQRDGGMYTTMQAEVAAGLADLVAQGFDPTIRGGMFVQGEYDSGSAVTAAAYESGLTQLITNLRTDYGQDFRFVFNQLHASLPEHWPSLQWVGDIRQAQLNVALSVPNTRLVNVDDLELDPRDYLHFSPAMQDTLGQMFATSFLSPADLNYDGVIDGTDFLTWQRIDGSATTLAQWESAFNSANTVLSIPEPSSLVLIIILLLSFRFVPSVVSITSRTILA